VRVLLDENLPHDLASLLGGHDVATVQGLGWTGVTNGELLRRASGRIDVLMTMDRKLEHQQNLSVFSFGVIVLRARSNRLADLVPLVDEISAALEKAQAGNVQHVGA
jgi:hypothetical protein